MSKVENGHVPRDLLDAAVDLIRQSPSSEGRIELIVRRPAVGAREVLQQAQLTIEGGLAGDNWSKRWSGKEEELQRHQDMQINLMNSRVIDVIAGGDQSLWPLAGDQFFVDFDLSINNLPAGTKLQVGEAVLEVTAEPHLGCRKFKQRFGKDAVMFVNSDEAKLLNLRGINARVISPGVVTHGGVISKLAPF
jgi:hypothetical protein